MRKGKGSSACPGEETAHLLLAVHAAGEEDARRRFGDAHRARKLPDAPFFVGENVNSRTMRFMLSPLRQRRAAAPFGGRSLPSFYGQKTAGNYPAVFLVLRIILRLFPPFSFRRNGPSWHCCDRPASSWEDRAWARAPAKNMRRPQGKQQGQEEGPHPGAATAPTTMNTAASAAAT